MSRYSEHSAISIARCLQRPHPLQFKASKQWATHSLAPTVSLASGLDCYIQRAAHGELARLPSIFSQRYGSEPQRDKADREPDAAAVHLLQAPRRPVQEGQGALRAVRRRPAAAPLLHLRQALPLPLAHRPLCQGPRRQVRGRDAHQGLDRHSPGAARGAGERGAHVRAHGEGAAVHDGGRRGAVHGAVAGAAGAQPGGGRAQGALREGPQDRRRDQLPREHHQRTPRGALRVVRQVCSFSGLEQGRGRRFRPTEQRPGTQTGFQLTLPRSLRMDRRLCCFLVLF